MTRLFSATVSVRLRARSSAAAPTPRTGESVGCVAITGNASVATIFATAIMAIVASFVAPFVTFLATIPNCVMGGVCITLYGASSPYPA